jgi:2-polyprenyl-6-methoxyphenol hydroxylase-like FAD-dependent oxidoreductase
MTSRRILVVGGSLGGLFAANVLLRAGHDVTLLEKAEASLDGRGAGIVTHRGLLEALRAAGAVVDETLGVPVRERVALDARGATVARTTYPQVLTSWSRLYALLRDALPAERHRAGHEAVELTARADGVQLRCRHGASFDAELLVASDGIRSVVRGRLAPQVQPQYAGYVAWRGVCDEAVLSRRTHETLFDHFGFGLPDGEQIIGYPVAGAGNATQPGQRRYNFVWYRPAAEPDELRALMTDADGTHHPGGIAPNKVSWREIARMRETARARLAPQWAEVIEKTAQPFLQPIFDLMSERIAFDRVALMGDAAFVARPHVGMGVTKAGDDALALARALASTDTVAAALQAYEAERLAPGRAVVERARRLGAYMQATATPGLVERDTLGVLNETAIDLAAA